MEIWKDIVGKEGKYQISNEGRVKSLNYRHTGKEGILKPKYTQKHGHLFVQLYNGNGLSEYPLIHHLVAEAFIENSNNYDIVHHIDHNPQNNRTENLMWMSKEEHDKLHQIDRALVIKNNLSKMVYQYTLDGELVAVWKSAREAAKQLGFDYSAIAHCCRGAYGCKTYKGYKWSYKPL